MKYSCPALIFALFRLSLEILNRPMDGGYMEQQEETKQMDEDDLPLKLTKADHGRIFKVVAELIGLIKGQYPELALRLYL